MKQTLNYKELQIGNVPAILYGEPSDKLYLFIHGQGGNKEDSAMFAEIAGSAGWQVLGIDLPGHGARSDKDRFVPWVVVPELRQVFDNVSPKYKHIALNGNSIGAWFGMLALAEKQLEQALFVSPILDMYRLIQNMMQWAGVTSEQLQREKVIATDFGHTLSWEYLTWVQEHPVTHWEHHTSILWAEKDHLTERSVIDAFIQQFGGELTVLENSEHWIHTPEQLEVMGKWMRQRV